MEMLVLEEIIFIGLCWFHGRMYRLVIAFWCTGWESIGSYFVMCRILRMRIKLVVRICKFKFPVIRYTWNPF